MLFIYNLRGIFIYYLSMADVSLDDLIKQDKEKNKVNRLNKVFQSLFQKPPQKKLQANKKNDDNQNQGRPNQNSNQHQQQDNRPFKKKFIKKDREDRNKPRDDREKQFEKVNKPREEKR